MNPLCNTLCLLAVGLGLLAVVATGFEQTAANQEKEQSAKAAADRRDVTEEMHLITKSLEDLLGELDVIKREANGRLISVKNRAAMTSDQERIRQTKVSRFVLKRVAELESESLGMRDELAKLFAAKPAAGKQQSKLEARQEDHDFDSEPQGTTTTKAVQPATASGQGMPASTTTMKPDEEAAKIGFDLEALKRLGADLESEIEGRAQQQTPESLRGVHESVIRLVDNMVNNYLANVRRAVQRMNNFIDNRQSSLATGSQPREAPGSLSRDEASSYSSLSQSVVDQLKGLSQRMREFTMQWARVVGKQQSPLIDRIPPRGVELWRDFWDTVRRQVRRINQEFYQLSQDMARMLTGRLPAGGSSSSTRLTLSIERPREDSLLYSSGSGEASPSERVVKQFQEFYDKLSVTLGEEQKKMDQMADSQSNQKLFDPNSLIDESDDEQTRNELTRNVALRQQIQQEINVFGSIFDIMRTFIQRLRESASVMRDVLQPGAMNNNDAVTPGPQVKPQVDKLLEQTINSQRDINSQAKPVLLPNNRPSLNQQG